MQLSTEYLISAKHIYIAYSGGLDSHVLLHLCSVNPQIKNKITAVYVHHGLQKIADDWAAHCQQQSQLLEIDCKILSIDATASKGESPEEVAREARYHALKKLMEKDDVLLVAQHQDDQLETVLLQLFRGAGVQGLSAMAEISAFGQGQLIRPLLSYSQQSLKNYAIEQHLHWVEDPSNQCDDFERNFLRNQIIPSLKTHWPTLDKTVARSAKHCANAQQLLTEVATQLLTKLINVDNSLSIDGLLLLNSPQQSLVIRQWFAALNLKMPSVTFIAQLFNDVIAAKKSSNPILKRNDCHIRRYQNKLYCLNPENNSVKSQIWLQSDLHLSLSQTHSLQRLPSKQGISQHLWHISTVSIRYRIGGEKINLPYRRGHHTLKKLFQEVGIPPWEREQIPLIYFDDKLVAVADLWIDSYSVGLTDEDCYQLKWHR
ncbi:MAG: tRNA lysidine(34) synthetase TilS [Methylococcales bacterium]|nr:tRNA lysidine(34) synthetase TilS [Methylococcales bacterium]